MSNQRHYLDTAASHLHKAIDELYRASAAMMSSGDSRHEDVSAIADSLLQKIKLVHEHSNR